MTAKWHRYTIWPNSLGCHKAIMVIAGRRKLKKKKQLKNQHILYDFFRRKKESSDALSQQRLLSHQPLVCPNVIDKSNWIRLVISLCLSNLTCHFFNQYFFDFQNIVLGHFCIIFLLIYISAQHVIKFNVFFSWLTNYLKS